MTMDPATIESNLPSEPMRILIAEDNAVPRLMLKKVLDRLGHQVAVTEDGNQAWEAICADPPQIAILDWMMPELDGIEVCRRLREERERFDHYIYVIMLTSRTDKEDMISGLEAGADEYMSKPFDQGVLAARVRTGQRIVQLQQQLAGKVSELEGALAHVKQLQGLLPICMHCKSIRDDSETWQNLESYISRHSEVAFSHSVCESCLREHYPEDEDDDE